MTLTEPITPPAGAPPMCPPCPPTNALVCPFCGRRTDEERNAVYGTQYEAQPRTLRDPPRTTRLPADTARAIAPHLRQGKSQAHRPLVIAPDRNRHAHSGAAATHGRQGDSHTVRDAQSTLPSTQQDRQGITQAEPVMTFTHVFIILGVAFAALVLLGRDDPRRSAR